MSFQNCPKCGKLFNSANASICEECVRKGEIKFEEVRLFAKENPSANMIAISKATGVSVGKILGYVRAGKIEISLESGDGITCEKCGKDIVTGRFCIDCADRLSDRVMGQLEESRSESRNNNSRMFTRD